MKSNRKHKFAAYTDGGWSSNYAGELARPHVAAALLSGVTLDQRTITVLENVKYKSNLAQLGQTDLLQAATCDFTLADDTAITYSERVLEPAEMQVNAKLCKNTWVAQWEAVNMGPGRKDHTIAPNISSFLLEHIAGAVAEEVEYTIWQGDTGGSYARFDGLVKLGTAAFATAGLYWGGPGAAVTNHTDITALSQAGEGDPTDADQVITVFEEFLSVVDTKVLQSSDFTIYCNAKVLYALRRAQAALGFKDDYYERQGQITSFLGYRVAPAYGLQDTRIVATRSSNLYFGTDLLSDHIEANVIDMGLTTGDNHVRIVMRMTGGVQIAVTGDYYHYAYSA